LTDRGQEEEAIVLDTEYTIALLFIAWQRVMIRVFKALLRIVLTVSIITKVHCCVCQHQGATELLVGIAIYL